MTTFILTLVVLGLIIIAMSVGVLFGRKPIKGSCGGMGALGMDTACDICGGNTKKCEEEQLKNQQSTSSKTGSDESDLAYDASKK